jgi:hypothetical protein
LPRRPASKRPWLGADNGLYVGYAPNSSMSEKPRPDRTNRRIARAERIRLPGDLTVATLWPHFFGSSTPLRVRPSPCAVKRETSRKGRRRSHSKRNIVTSQCLSSDLAAIGPQHPLLHQRRTVTVDCSPEENVTAPPKQRDQEDKANHVNDITHQAIRQVARLAKGGVGVMSLVRKRKPSRPLVLAIALFVPNQSRGHFTRSPNGASRRSSLGRSLASNTVENRRLLKGPLITTKAKWSSPIRTSSRWLSSPARRLVRSRPLPTVRSNATQKEVSCVRLLSRPIWPPGSRVTATEVTSEHGMLTIGFDSTYSNCSMPPADRRTNVYLSGLLSY